jgi:hypothetical protein
VLFQGPLAGRRKPCVTGPACGVGEPAQLHQPFVEQIRTDESRSKPS